MEASKVTAWFEETYGDLSPATWNTERSCLVAALRFWGATYGCRTTLPLSAKPNPESDNSRAMPLADLEWILSRSVTGWRDLQRTKLLAAMLYETAARSHEVLSLDVGDLDTRERCALVRGKGGRPAYIWWGDRTSRFLPRYLGIRTTGPVYLTKRGTRLSYDQASADFSRLSGGRYTLHQLRHARLTHLAEQGISTEMLRVKSRHRDVASLNRYARPSVSVVQRWESAHGP